MPARFRFTPCPRCCDESCVIDRDPFDTDLSKWTTFSGSWSVSGGLLTGSGAGLLALNEPALTEDDGVHWLNHPKLTGSAGTIRFAVAFTDADNYLWGELAIPGGAGAGTIKVGERVAGADSDLSDPVTLTDTGSDLLGRHDVALCWTPGTSQTPQALWTTRFPRTVGGTAWTTPNNARVIDGSLATWPGSSWPTNPLAGSKFRFSIPAGSTINGVRVSAYCRSMGVATVVDQSVTLSGAIVSDDRATSTNMPITTFGWVSWGGSTDTWGAVPALTPEIINRTDFGPVFVWDLAGMGGASFDVDAMEVTVYYTTPDRAHDAELRILYTNTGGGDPQCAVVRNIATPGGLKAGIRIVSGDWDFTESVYSYQLSAARPSCPQCGCTPPGQPCDECCDSDNPPLAEYVVGIASGLTDEECDFCDEIAGDFVVTQGGSIFTILGVCIWSYSEPIDCPELTGPCPDVGTTGYWEVAVFLEHDPVQGDCKWVAVVAVQMAGSTKDPTDDGNCSGPGGLATYAIYESDFIDNDCTDLPQTLNLVIQEVGGVMCSGSFPGSITLDAP